MVRKDADALKNWSPESNLDIAATQRELIDSAFHALRHGGTLVYSTCTLNREENQSVIHWLLSRYPQAVEIQPLEALFPGAADALTVEDFCMSSRRSTIVKASLSLACARLRRSIRSRRRAIRSASSRLCR